MLAEFRDYGFLWWLQPYSYAHSLGRNRTSPYQLLSTGFECFSTNTEIDFHERKWEYWSYYQRLCPSFALFLLLNWWVKKPSLFIKWKCLWPIKDDTMIDWRESPWYCASRLEFLHHSAEQRVKHSSPCTTRLYTFIYVINKPPSSFFNYNVLAWCSW